MEQHLGNLRTVGGRPVLRFERELAHPPEKVWKAVTDPAEMAHWFPANIETEPAIGAAMRFSFGDDALDGGGQYAHGEVLEFDPPKVFAFRWVDDVLRFEIVANGAGCRLVFTYTMGGTDTTNDRPSVARNGPGWDVCLAFLAAQLDGGPAPQPDDAWFLDRAERYVEEFGLGEGEVRDAGDGYLVRFERDLTQSVEQVWAALIDGTQPVADEEPPLRFTHGYFDAGAVTTLDAPHVLEYAWARDGSPAGRVRFELNRQRPLGCRLVITQTLPAESAGLVPTTLAAWQTHLEVLFATLNGTARCWPAERTDQLLAMYAGRLQA